MRKGRKNAQEGSEESNMDKGKERFESQKSEKDGRASV